MTGYGYGYGYGESLTFSIGYEDVYVVLEVPYQLEIRYFILYKLGANLTLKVNFMGLN